MSSSSSPQTDLAFPGSGTGHAVHYPNWDQFQDLANQGLEKNRTTAEQANAEGKPFAVMVPVYRQLFSDTLTPVSAYSRIRSSTCSFLFESVVGGEQVGRYSFSGANPFLTISASGESVVIETDPSRTMEVPTTYTSQDPLGELEALLGRYPGVHLPELPRFIGGAVGYAGYDTVRYVEHLPKAPYDDRQLPDLVFSIYDLMVIFDHIQKTVLVVAHVPVYGKVSLADYESACERIDLLVEKLSQPDQLAIADVKPLGPVSEGYTSNFSQAGFEEIVEKAKEYIRSGDIFQVVLSQRLTRRSKASPLDIYRALRVVNPSPFMFLLETADSQLIGASPEIMVRVEEGETTIRPLAGTRRRGRTIEEDRALEIELLADEKELAEHIMLVDLARNDVGRVAAFGTIRLSDMMRVERYSHVMHITSNVSGQLAEGKTPLDALRSGLPAGTVSGAPKVRAMQIIDELEPHRRGPYGGAVGYIDFSGNLDTCIALRTLVVKDGVVYLQAGAGIVADSVPALEYEETLNKAKALLRAIEVAEKQLTQ
ncbi:anthranilate synthase component I [Planctopirus limnophila DSM 3776]|uniref:Anthranilate synthase component 1 n=1 Tax=Planctopirus limnophila (strain ATCC 43296 / DSM 3776 / IFAM 1008 / Mu 290) TaxID=521674 RepID=D5SRS2_PLAL2|nr:anthranilate synthase component I [Planctopirus limnophila]ADG66606.1 anthranilate synthase component I [Planctopirus limnophila DSM 3776]